MVVTCCDSGTHVHSSLAFYLVPNTWWHPVSKLWNLRLCFTWEWPVFPLQEQPNQVNYGNICTGLEVLNFLLTVLQSPAILSSFKPLQRGIAACMTCGNTKVLRAVHSLLSRLMSIFPTEPSKQPSPRASPLPETGGPGTVAWECPSCSSQWTLFSHSVSLLILLFCFVFEKIKGFTM